MGVLNEKRCKRCYYGDESRDGEPEFPYPDIQDEYYDDVDNTKWKDDYPLINIYNEEWNQWDDNRNEQNEKDKHLKKCPLCCK